MGTVEDLLYTAVGTVVVGHGGDGHMDTVGTVDMVDMKGTVGRSDTLDVGRVYVEGTVELGECLVGNKVEVQVVDSRARVQEVGSKVEVLVEDSKVEVQVAGSRVRVLGVDSRVEVRVEGSRVEVLVEGSRTQEQVMVGSKVEDSKVLVEDSSSRGQEVDNKAKEEGNKIEAMGSMTPELEMEGNKVADWVGS